MAPRTQQLTFFLPVAGAAGSFLFRYQMSRLSELATCIDAEFIMSKLCVPEFCCCSRGRRERKLATGVAAVLFAELPVFGGVFLVWEAWACFPWGLMSRAITGDRRVLPGGTERTFRRAGAHHRQHWLYFKAVRFAVSPVLR